MLLMNSYSTRIQPSLYTGRALSQMKCQKFAIFKNEWCIKFQPTFGRSPRRHDQAKNESLTKIGIIIIQFFMLLNVNYLFCSRMKQWRSQLARGLPDSALVKPKRPKFGH